MPYTNSQKILLAARDIAGELPRMGDPFQVGALVERAWKLYPDAFRLVGSVEDLPDSNRIQSKLCGRDGLVALGWFARTDRKGWVCLTKRGMNAARELVAAKSKSVTEPRAPAVPANESVRAKPRSSVPELTEEESRDIARIVRMSAFAKFRRGHRVTFADACNLWGSSRPTTPDVERVGRILQRGVSVFGEEAGDAPNARFVDCYSALNMHRLMVRMFGREVREEVRDAG